MRPGGKPRGEPQGKARGKTQGQDARASGRRPARRDAARSASPDGSSPASLAEQALARALEFDAPADAVLRRFFAAHPQMGRRDRAEVAERVFDVLRNRRLYAHLAQSGSGSLAARLIALSRQRSPADPSGLTAEAGRRAHPPDVRLSALAPEVRLSLPDWLYQRLVRRMPQAQVEALGVAMLEAAPLDLRANLLRADRDSAIAALRADGIECEPSVLAPTGIRVAGKPALERAAAFRDGLVEVQDCGSQLVAELVAPRRGQTVIDFCAGAGGKTLALAALLRGSGQVFACDVSTARLQRLRPRLARSGATNVQPFGIDSETDPKLVRMEGKADAVLVDAPCSGTGTLRRNPDLKWRQTESDIAELVAKQRAILAAAARLVRPGGVLVYATCSLLEEENEEVRRWFEHGHPGWEVDPAAAVLARRAVDLSPLLDDECLVLRPDTHDADAFFAVRWVRPA